MKRAFCLTFLCGGLAFLQASHAPAIPRRQFPPAAAPAPADAQARYDKAAAEMDKIQNLLDAPSRALLPGMKGILQKVCFAPETATDDEKELVAPFLPAEAQAGDSAEAQHRGDPTVVVSRTQQQLGKMTVNASFLCKSLPPDGHGFVVMKANGAGRIVVEIPSGSGKMTPLSRARLVAERMQQTSARDGLWWHQLKKEQRGGQWVVSTPGAPGGFLVTADRDFARQNQLTEAQLAQSLIDNIASAMRGTRGAVPETPEEMQMAAIAMRQKGDAALEAGDMALAETCYTQAKNFMPDYIMAALRLAHVYAQTGRKDQARTLLKQAMALKTITPELRQAAEQQLKTIK